MSPFGFAAASRRLHWVAFVVGVAAIPGCLLTKFAFGIKIHPNNPTNYLPVSEMISVLALCATVTLVTPRLWVIERTARSWRRRWGTVMSTAACFAAPQLVLLAARVTGMSPGTAGRAQANLLFLSALGVALAAFIGAAAASGSLIVIYFAAASALQMVPLIGPFLPLAPSESLHGHWTYATACAVVAPYLAIRLVGQTAWVQRRQ